MGEDSVGDAEAVLAGADAEVADAVRALLGQFPFTLDAFQVKSIALLLAGKSGALC